MTRWVGLWGLCVASVGPLLLRSDPDVAQALVVTAVELAPADRLDRVWLEAARANSGVLPWHPHHASARDVVREVAGARRAVLAHDRGGRRALMPVPPDREIP